MARRREEHVDHVKHRHDREEKADDEMNAETAQKALLQFKNGHGEETTKNERPRGLRKNIA